MTDLELKIMKAGCDSDYDNFCEEPTWVFDVIDKSEIGAKQARGVISSLVKKGLVEVFDNEGHGNPNDMAIVATESGVEICRDHNFLQ